MLPNLAEVPRPSSIVVSVVAFVVAGFMLPVLVLIWLLAHHEPPYTLDRAAMENARTALGGNPVAVRPAGGVFDVVTNGGTTAVYADGSTATFVRTPRPSQTIGKYGSSLDERTSMSSTVGGFTRRDATLADGRSARTFGIDGTVFAFVAPSALALDRLVAQSAIRRNTKRDVGNAVLDDHTAASILIGLGWMAVATLATTLAVVRAVRGPNRAGPAAVPWYRRPS